VQQHTFLDNAAIELGKSIIKTTGMNRDTLKLRYKRSYITFLAKRRVVLIVELRVENCNEHQSIIN
jgi:hypothetical protein